MTDGVDVVVVGAGFAGLTTAWQLHEKGVSVVVLEASDRVGGRTDTVRRDGRWLEAGGQWTGPGQHRVRALADHYGVGLFDTPHEGEDLQLVNGALQPLEDNPPYAPMITALDELVPLISGEHPWVADSTDRSRAIRTLDEQAVADWLSENTADAGVARSVRQVLEGLMTVPLEEMSVLTVLHSAHTSGSLAAALGIDGGAQEQRLLGGLHQLAGQMASDLGDAVRLSTPVTAIAQSDRRVEVSTDAATFSATRCVVAVPPSGWSTMRFTPELPGAHRALTQLMPLGSVIKLQLVYERPFWRDEGLSGLVLDDTGPFAFLVDNSSPDRNEGVLATFLSAAEARRFGDAQLGANAAEIRQRMLVEHVSAALGSNGAQPIAYFDRDWDAVPWVGGGYSGVMRPGGWLHAGPALREPVGRVHWASAESAMTWNGYVEGAIEAGQRVASDVAGLI